MSYLQRLITTPLRQWLEDQRAVRQGQRELAGYGQTYYGFWQLPPMEQRWFYRFLQRPIFSQVTPAKQLQFFSVFGRRRLLRMAATSAPKIFFTGENLAHYPPWKDHALAEVDLALGFARLPAANYLRFPLWLLDIFDPAAELAEIESQLATLNAASKSGNRHGFAALIARHDNSGLRGELADILAGFGQVDYPGKFRNNIQPGLPEGYPSKLAFLRQYKLNICPENSNAAGYVTEKIWHAIAAGCIPVYWGNDSLPEPDILSQEAILCYEPEHPERLTQQLEDLCQSPQRLTAFAQQARFQPAAAEHVYAYYLKLEQSLLQILNR